MRNPTLTGHDAQIGIAKLVGVVGIFQQLLGQLGVVLVLLGDVGPVAHGSFTVASLKMVLWHLASPA